MVLYPSVEGLMKTRANISVSRERAWQGNVKHCEHETCPPGQLPTQYPHQVRHEECGEHLTIPCQSMKSVPVATITWTLAESSNDKSPQALQLDKRINQDEHGYLHFAFLNTSDAQERQLYICNSFNPHLRRTVGGSATIVNVNDVPLERKKPHLESSSDDVKVGLVDGTITLKCFFSGNPAPQVSWSRVGGQLPGSRSSWIKDAGTLLELSNLEETDEGQYKCQGANSGGSEEHIMTIDIQSEPMFESKDKRPHNYNATEGEDVTFTCDPKAEPDADVTWYINGKKLNVKRPGAGKLISNDKKYLTLKNMCKGCTTSNSLMNVQCMAKNIHGSVIANGYLNVLKRTEIVVAPEDIVLVYGKKVIMRCEAKSDDSTPVLIRWLKDDVEVHYIEHHISVNSTDYSLHIRTEADSDQGASYKGNYTCIATNMYSVVQASAEIVLPVGPVSSVVPGVPVGSLWWIFVHIAIILLR
ncbi:hypothetical protein LSAT2_003345 [Lamellibrachia satsuma]|nr:hypothetical protein LSAT2_003345 [Lamellibrachia satsuma]